MCGIAGIYGTHDFENLLKMMNAQQHRGLDGRNTWISSDGMIMFGHDRLAIIDVDGGTQPILNEDQSMACIVNGEIYNYHQLKASLTQIHHFATQSDSEILLHLLEERGLDFVTQLDGMFAFAIWSDYYGLILGRDPLGKKPLYFGYDIQSNLYFSSEIKPLLLLSNEIKTLPPGSIWVIPPYTIPDEKNIHPFYTIPIPRAEFTQMDDAVNRLDIILVNAIKKRLMADVPVGAFLSGGLDSSLITAIMRRLIPSELHTFSIGLEGSTDILNARKVAKYLGTIHHERIVGKDELLNSLPDVIMSLESFDPALIRSSVATYLVSELASKYVKVVLSGEGADELFAGYHYLANLNTSTQLPQELYRITSALHNTNLQRGDRMTMAHGLEARMPFFDLKIIDFAFHLDPNLLVSTNQPLTSNSSSDWQGKMVLRKLAERYLPSEIVWRKKEKFAIGTGIASILESYANQTISDAEFTEHKMQCPFRTTGFFSKEMYYYWTLFPTILKRNDVLTLIGQSRSLNPGQQYS